MPPNRPENLRPHLDEVHRTLEEALNQACRVRVRDADTGELIRIEEVLAIANEAAREAISARRQIRREPGFRRPDRERLPGDDSDNGSVETHRIVEDARGVRWDVFAVYPSIHESDREELPVGFEDGWLAFDSGMERRRTPVPNRWLRLSDDELLQLCREAVPTR
ncbi:MAG: hypothetical protein ABJF01_20365 [bacterium]